MSTPDPGRAITSATSSTAQPNLYSSYEDLRSVGNLVMASPAAQRIFWPLDGPFPAAISVMKDTHSPTAPLTPYITDGVWHPISREPVSEPRVSSITVGVDELDIWEATWTDMHQRHGDIGDQIPGRAYGALEVNENRNENEESDPYYDPNQQLIMCCGENRPQGKKTRLLVTPAVPASADGHEGGFVTVHDYLSAVHPWLMSLRGNIVSSRNVWNAEPEDLMVYFNMLGHLLTDDRQSWIARKSVPPVQPVQATALLAQGMVVGPSFGPPGPPGPPGPSGLGNQI